MDRVRFLALPAAIFPLLGSALMMIIGAAKTLKSFAIYFLEVPIRKTPPLPERLTYTDQTMINILEAIDAFLIALALLLFAAGVYNLFIAKLSFAADWLHINSIESLKKVLMEVILVVLTVLFLRALLLFEDPTWKFLIVPLSVALFALALHLVDWSSHRSRETPGPEKQEL